MGEERTKLWGIALSLQDKRAVYLELSLQTLQSPPEDRLRRHIGGEDLMQFRFHLIVGLTRQPIPIVL